MPQKDDLWEQFRQRELTLDERAFLKTLPAGYGDSWEDDLRVELARQKRFEPVPPLNKIIDLKHKGKPLYWTERFLTAKTADQLKQVILEGLEWTKR